MNTLCIVAIISPMFLVNYALQDDLAVLVTKSGSVKIAVPKAWKIVRFGSELERRSGPITLRFNVHAGLFHSGLMPRDAAEITISWLPDEGSDALRVHDSLGSVDITSTVKMLKCKNREARTHVIYQHRWFPGPDGDAYLDSIAYFPVGGGTVRVVLHTWEKSRLPTHVQSYFEEILCSISTTLAVRNRKP